MTNANNILVHSPLPPDALCVGIDVAKDALDLFRSDTGERQRFANSDEGIAALVASLTAPAPAIVVVESTGGLERPLTAALLEAAFPVALVQPGRVRNFAKALGLLAKTDALDASVLAEFGRRGSPRILEKRAGILQELEALVTCRRQLASTRSQQLTRLKSTRGKPATNAHDAVLATLNHQIKKLDGQIEKLIDSDDTFDGANRLLQSAPGVGPVLASTLIAEMPELGKVPGKAIAALTGVAPMSDDSGERRGTRHIAGGRGDVRRVLYAATMNAMQHNPLIRAFAERLKAKNKPFRVVATAAMHKFITLLNAMLRENLTWENLKVVKATKIA